MSTISREGNVSISAHESKLTFVQQLLGEARPMYFESIPEDLDSADLDIVVDTKESKEKRRRQAMKMLRAAWVEVSDSE